MSINIEDVSVVFNRKTAAVNHAYLEIPEGVFGLLGENGAGKTTLMRVLTTVLTPSGGTVRMDGIPYCEKNYPKIRRNIGYLPQELDLYPGLTVQECLEYLGGLSGIPANVCGKRIEYYLEKTDLTEQRRKKIRQLSGGMKRRVGLVQALLHEPRFLVVDEPTAGLDPEERIRIRNLLVDFSENRTVLFSTHVVEDLEAVAGRIAVMRKGTFLYSGSVREMIGKARGHVWTCRVQEEKAREMEMMYKVSSKVMSENGVDIRLISSSSPQEDCVPAEPTLEDAYMYLMMDS